jgi:hypothetical protein
VLACSSENVALSGIETVLATDTITASGHRATQLVFNLRGVTATGLSSGTHFRVTGVTVTGSSFATGTLATASTSRFVQTWLLLPIGGGPPLSFHEVLTLIYDANGSLASIASQGPSDCN